MSAERTDPFVCRRSLRARLRGLYAVTPDLADEERLAALVDAALTGGACAIQYRKKSAPAEQKRRQAMRLARLCAARNILFIVNDDAQLARDVDADGVHLGEDDGDAAHARATIGDGRLIGVSCYDDAGRARDAVAAGADYVAFGSFFASPVKPAARHADVALLAQARSLSVPVVAIGGITVENARGLAAAGADAVAVISAVFAHEDLAAVSRAAASIAACFEPTLWPDPQPNTSRP
ncbi:MAG: thiamine phosphate synthase [Burkholderiales bacterium]|nr:thiamine phosphate synthase [Burkholderiales bacterium]